MTQLPGPASGSSGQQAVGYLTSDRQSLHGEMPCIRHAQMRPRQRPHQCQRRPAPRFFVASAPPFW